MKKKKVSEIFEGPNSSLMRAYDEAVFTIPAEAKKIRSDFCIVCGFDPKLKEKSIGCFYLGKKVGDRHQYLYYRTHPE